MSRHKNIGKLIAEGMENDYDEYGDEYDDENDSEEELRQKEKQRKKEMQKRKSKRYCLIFSRPSERTKSGRHQVLDGQVQRFLYE